MSKEYLITITGIQRVDGEEDKIEVITGGTYEQTADAKVIRYTEYGEEDPNRRTDTTVTVYHRDRLTIERAGETASTLLLERGRRHQCAYETPVGQMMIGVYTSEIRDTLTPSGGDLHASYQLDFYSDVVSENEFHISIKEKG